MKKFNLFLAALFVAVMGLTIVGCQKEVEDDLTQKSTEITASEIYAKNGMLVFASMESFQSTMSNLETKSIKHQEEFSSTVKNLNQEQYEAMVEKQSYNEAQVLIDFESKYKYVSLRSVIAEKMVEFNKIYDREKVECPDEHFVRNEYLRTLLNENCEVMIGTTIYKLLDNGATIQILNENYEIADKINSENFMKFDLNEEILVDYESSGKTVVCYNWDGFTRWYASNWLTYNGRTGKVKVRLDVDNNVFARNIRGVAKAEYWDGNSWKNWNLPKVWVEAGGGVYLINCGTNLTGFSDSDSRNSSDNVAVTCSIGEKFWFDNWNSSLGVGIYSQGKFYFNGVNSTPYVWTYYYSNYQK